MSKNTLYSGKGSASHQNSEVASGLLNEGFLAHDLSDNLRTLNVSNITVNPNSGVLVIDWDSPDDPPNPKK